MVPVDPPKTRRQAGKQIRLESNMVVIRWFGVAFGLFQVWQGASVPPIPPSSVLLTAYGLVAVLALGNAAVWMTLRRTPDGARLRRIGLWSFALDFVVVVGTSWIYSYDRVGTVWVLMYVLPLEGAMRFQLRGALWTVAISFVTELGREIYRASLFADLDFVLEAVTFRVGVLAIIAMFAGLMARSMARQADAADRRARAFEELARREAEARSELSAFQATVLAGIAGAEPTTALHSMAEAIGPRLGYESLCILIADGGELRTAATYGVHHERPGAVIDASSPAARAAAARAPLLADGGKEMAAPMEIGDRLIGVIHVEAALEGALGDHELGVLGRLADQVALVAYHAQLHAERAETVRRLEELAQMKSDFVAITSHELRTPLTGIRGFASILHEQFDVLASEDVREYLRIIDEQSKRLSRLVEDLLVVAKLDNGRLKLAPRDIEVRPFVDDIVASFADDAARIDVEVHEPAWAHLDPDRVEQMLRNLIHNGLKFSPTGGRVTVRARGLGDAIEFEVSDHGVGIAPDEAAKIFERFHQVNATTQQGVGLGLYITKRLVDEMAGEIEVDSVPGDGATFRFRIPQHAAVPDRVAS